MFTKIHLAFYNVLFEIYGKLGQYYYQKSTKVDGEEAKIRWKKRAWKCFDKREDILDIMFTLKGFG
jgi:hypothetical protein